MNCLFRCVGPKGIHTQCLYPTSPCSKFFFDLPALLLVLVLVCMGVGFGLLAFFELQVTTNRTIQKALEHTASDRASQFASDITRFTENMDTMVTVASLFHSSFNLSSSSSLVDDPFGPAQYAQLVNRSHLLVNGIISMSWHPRVLAGTARTNFVTRMRQYAATDAAYTDFEVVGYVNSSSAAAATGELVVRQEDSETVQAYGMFPTAFIFPYADGKTSVIGFDPSSENDRAGTMLKSFSDSKTAMTPNLSPPQDTPMFQVYEAVISPPAYDGQPKLERLLGFVRGILIMTELVKKTQWRESSNIYSAVFDDDLLARPPRKVSDLSFDPNDVEERKAFVFSNVQSYSKMKHIFKTAKFISVQHVVIVDRNWTIFYAPKDSFLTVGTDAQRNQFVALFVILVCFVLMALCVIGAIVVKHFVVRNYVQMAYRERVDALQENNCKLENLLDRIAIEEHRTRGVMNSVPFAVLVVDKNGKFLEFNKLFRTVFGQGAKGLSKMAFNQIFPNYKDPDTLYDTFVNQVSETNAQMIPMELTSKFNNKIQSEISVTRSQAMVGSRDDHLYIIIIKASPDTMKQASTASNPYSPTSPLLPNMVTFVDNSDLAFHKTIQDEIERTKFKNFCSQMHNDESILFIEAVIDYRETKNTVERITKQEYIYETFLRRKAKKELNLPGNLMESEQAHVRNGLGQPDVFDVIYKAVCSLLQQDAFRSYQMAHGARSSVARAMEELDQAGDLSTQKDVELLDQVTFNSSERNL